MEKVTSYNAVHLLVSNYFSNCYVIGLNRLIFSFRRGSDIEVSSYNFTLCKEPTGIEWDFLLRLFIVLETIKPRSRATSPKETVLDHVKGKPLL